MDGQTLESTPPCVDLNAAGRDELVSSLPGIGPALADRIIAFREGNGPFSDPTDLARVPGIGPRRAERLSARLSARPSRPSPAADGGEVEPPSTDPAAPGGVFIFDSDPVIRPEPFGFASAAPGKAAAVPRVATPAETLEGASSEPDGDDPTAEDGSVAVASSVDTPQLDERVLPRAGRRYATMVAMALFGLVVGGVGAVHSERKAVAVVRQAVDHDVRALRVDESKTEGEVARQAGELARQAAELAATRQALAAAVEAQTAAAAKAEGRADRISQEVAEISERARRAQARTDARVYRLDEAVTLIDWATMGGAARATAGPASVVPRP